MTHDLKTLDVYFDAVVRGEKRFEVRQNDRGFQKGDVVVLHRWAQSSVGLKEDLSADPISFRIGYILQGGQFGIAGNYCVMQLEPVE